MFISSMARKNSERARRQRSQSTSSLRRSMESQSSMRTNDNADSRAPRSAVGKSLRWCVNGEEKPLLATRDIKNTSNSEKTIRPSSSKAKLSSSKTSLAQGIEKSTPVASPQPATYPHIRVEKHIQPPPSSGTSFIDSPNESSWYLEPMHRAQLSSSQDYPLYGTSVHSVPRAGSALQFGDGIPTTEFLDDTSALKTRLGDLRMDDEIVESERDFRHLKTSRILEEQALARASSTSPYELELCKLRKEKLRLEESYLLKRKCNLELERTRAPVPRWYELKSRQFTTEREKYDNMMNNRKYWNEILDYRNSLVRTSMRLADTSGDSYGSF